MTALRFPSFAISSRNSYRETAITTPPSAHFGSADIHFLRRRLPALDPVLLQTSRMWRPLIPHLAEKFTVIAPDLPGIAGSSVPNDGLDTKTAAMRVHSLAKSLNVDRARVVGHKGEHVIVSGAAGSVGQAAIQMRG
jgi:hypothetical protein